MTTGQLWCMWVLGLGAVGFGGDAIIHTLKQRTQRQKQP